MTTPAQTTLFDTGHNARLPDTLTVDQLAHLLGVTTVWIQTAARNGLIIKNNHGSYPLETIPHYIEGLRNRAKGRGAAEGDETVAQIRIDKERYERDIAQHKARLLELEARQKENELVEVAEVEENLVRVLTTIKAKLRAIPNGLAARVRVTNTDTAAHALLTTAINNALAELSKLGVDDEPHPDSLPVAEGVNQDECTTNPSDPSADSRTKPKAPRAKRSSKKGSAEPSPTPPANGEPVG